MIWVGLLNLFSKTLMNIFQATFPGLWRNRNLSQQNALVKTKVTNTVKPVIGSILAPDILTFDFLLECLGVLNERGRWAEDVIELLHAQPGSSLVPFSTMTITL